MKTGGGSFLYHLEDNQVAVGFVVHLNYKNPISRRSRNSSVSRRIRRSANGFEGGKRIWPMARARSPKAATSRCPSWPSRAAR
jgi:electron-transferring-flavoprotein dehydrogenase